MRLHKLTLLSVEIMIWQDLVIIRDVMAVVAVMAGKEYSS